MQNLAYPLIDLSAKNLQSEAVLPSLRRNTPAMPIVASAAKHKLSGFFLPGVFRA
jgi:hypothetical protein